MKLLLPESNSEIDIVRWIAGNHPGGTAVYIAKPCPEDEALCREVHNCLARNGDAYALRRAEWSERAMPPKEAREWHDAMLGIATDLLVVSTAGPSAEAQLEILRALEAKKNVRLVQPWGVEITPEFAFLAKIYGEFETLRWERHQSRAKPLAPAIAGSYWRPRSHGYWYPGGIAVAEMPEAA
jgi:hypothetical protein